MSLHSMTAFARESIQEPAVLIVELRSVNHRYLDCHFKLPEHLRALEPRLREALARSLKRGKVDCHIRAVENEEASSLAVDQAYLDAVLAALDKIRERTDALAAPSALELLRFPGVCESNARDEGALQKSALEVFERALEGLLESRAREGTQLGEFLLARLDAISAEVERVQEELPALRQRQEERLRRRLEDLEQPLDEGRLEQELVIALQKSDVDEELDRLRAHIEEVRRVVAEGGPCGRRLDFLMQELNREANTLSSKSIASSTTQSAVELKVLIEQMREQVQNVE